MESKACGRSDLVRQVRNVNLACVCGLNARVIWHLYNDAVGGRSAILSMVMF
jgi:hypothetical protein